MDYINWVIWFPYFKAHFPISQINQLFYFFIIILYFLKIFFSKILSTYPNRQKPLRVSDSHLLFHNKGKLQKRASGLSYTWHTYRGGVMNAESSLGHFVSFYFIIILSLLLMIIQFNLLPQNLVVWLPTTAIACSFHPLQLFYFLRFRFQFDKTILYKE